jgi:hypothetical protein
MAMRETLDEFIGAGAVSRVDVEAIMRRSRVIRRRRRVATACATGLAVVGVTALTVAVAPGPQAAPGPASTAGTGTASPQPAQRERLLAALKAAIAREAPNVTGLDTFEPYVHVCIPGRLPDLAARVPQREAATHPPCPSPPRWDDTRHHMWEGRLTSPTGTYVVSVSIGPGVHVDPSAPASTEGGLAEQRIAAEAGQGPVRGPNGESILVRDALLNMTKPDGTGIMITTRDVNQVGAYLTRGPFTRDQLTAIGLDRDLHV